MAELSSKLEASEKSLLEKSSELDQSENRFRETAGKLETTSEKLRQAETKSKDFLTTVEENIKTISLLEDEKNDLSRQLESKTSMLVRDFFPIKGKGLQRTEVADWLLIQQHQV